MRICGWGVATFAFFGSLLALPLYGQGTVFTYQGNLNSSGMPVSGAFDFVFAAYDSVVAGNRIGGSVTNASVSVVSGLFTTGIDLGTNVFTGGERWLEIAVRTNGTGPFSMLSPRQALTTVPYAIY